MRILICGAGAMGCLFGGYLSRAGHEVWLLSHWKEQMARIRAQGLLLHSFGGQRWRVPMRVVSYEEPLPENVKVAFICVKSYATAAAAEKAIKRLAPDGVAITLQNGLGNREQLAQVVGASRALLGVTSNGATLLGVGEVRHAGIGLTHLAAEPNRAAATRIAEMLTDAGFSCQVDEEIDAVVWGKLLINVGINALTAILRVPNGALADYESSRQLLRAAVEEGAAIARAKGISIVEDPVERTLAVARATATNRSSMLSDIQRGARTEIEVINGAIVREGAALGLPTPVNEILTRLVRALEAKMAL